jgi:hypothetical protein
MHWLLPCVAAAASAAFAAAVLRQYAARRRPHQLAWGIALSMFAVASLALTAGVAAGWTPLSFKLYYLFGAVLNVPWLALGTVELLARPALRRAYVAGLAAFTEAVRTSANRPGRPDRLTNRQYRLKVFRGRV